MGGCFRYGQGLGGGIAQTRIALRKQGVKIRGRLRSRVALPTSARYHQPAGIEDRISRVDILGWGASPLAVLPAMTNCRAQLILPSYRAFDQLALGAARSSARSRNIGSMVFMIIVSPQRSGCVYRSITLPGQSKTNPQNAIRLIRTRVGEHRLPRHGFSRTPDPPAA